MPRAICFSAWYRRSPQLIHPALLFAWTLVSPAAFATELPVQEPQPLPSHKLDAVPSKGRQLLLEKPLELAEIEMSPPEHFEPEAGHRQLEETQGTLPSYAGQASVSTEEETRVTKPTEHDLEEVGSGDRQRLFEQVFGKPQSGQFKTVLVPWRINQKRQGEIGIQVETNPRDIYWNATSFLRQLGEQIKPELREQLEEIEAQGKFSIDALKALNIDAQFNPKQLVLDITLMPEQLRTNVVAGSAVRKPRRGEPTVDSAGVSGYVNVRGNLGWDWISEKDETGRQPLDLSWDGVLNVGGWAMEGRVDYAEAGSSQWRRGDLRMVRDWAGMAMRAQAGEISTPTTGYQRSQSILGVAASRQFSIQPDRVTRPVSNYEFFLEAPSEVEIYVNGVKEQTLDLPAGTQDLRALSLGAGVNDIELLITDPVGRVQRLRFFAPVTAQLLAPGVQTFSYSLGLPVTRENDRRVYQWDAPLLTASHRWGLTDTLTSGAYLQANLNPRSLLVDPWQQQCDVIP